MQEALTGPCGRCGVHDAEVVKADSVLDWAHGHYEAMCRCCSAFESLKECRAAAARIADLEAELAAACGGSGEPPPEIPWGWVGYQDNPLRAMYWAETFDSMYEWVEAAPGRAGGGKMRRPAGITGDSGLIPL